MYRVRTQTTMAFPGIQTWVAVIYLTCGIYLQTGPYVALAQNKVTIGCFGSAGACLDHYLTCSNTNRVAIETAQYGHKTWQNCTTGVISCDDPCCIYLPDEDCFDTFKAGDITDIYRWNCSAHACHFRTPRLVLPCFRNSISFQAVSSYSVTEYKCVEESNIIPMCGAPSAVSGTSVYMMYDPKQQVKQLDDTCFCTVWHDSSKNTVVEGIDVRLKNNPECGRLDITDSLGSLSYDCSSKPLWPNLIMRNTNTSYLVLRLTGLPEFVWIRFSASDNLRVTCSLNAQHTTTPTTTVTYPTSPISTTTATTVTYPTSPISTTTTATTVTYPTSPISTTTTTTTVTYPTSLISTENATSLTSVSSTQTDTKTNTSVSTGSSTTVSGDGGSKDGQKEGNEGTEDFTVGAVAGGVIGGLLLLIIIGVLCVRCNRNSKPEKAQEPETYNTDVPVPTAHPNLSFSNATYEKVDIIQSTPEVTLISKDETKTSDISTENINTDSNNVSTLSTSKAVNSSSEVNGNITENKENESSKTPNPSDENINVHNVSKAATGEDNIILTRL